MKKLVVILAILAAAAACGGAAGSAGNSTSTQQGPLRLSQGAAGPAQLPSKSSGAPSGPTSGGGSSTNPATGTNVPVLQGPPVIRQAQLAISVASGSFDSKLSSVRTLVESEQGYIAGTDAQTNPVDNQIRTGVINFMVPATNFDATIDLLSKIGKVESEHIMGTDVSAQYVDLNARLANDEAQHAAMLALLTKAQSINDIIAVQNQIGQITGEIEQLKGQIKYLDDNTSFSSISVTLTEAGAPAQQQPADSWGLATAIIDAAHNFVTTINYMVTGLGAIGPFAVLLGLGYLVWRRRRQVPAVKHA
ncbi:MAG: DUF4349 domain-containing protein [Candidatus Dormibacteraceae bacterium]